MEIEIIKFIESMGIPASIAMLWAFIYYMKREAGKDKDAHREERKAWMQTLEQLVRDTNESRDRNTAVLTELKTIIDNRVERRAT